MYRRIKAKAFKLVEKPNSLPGLSVECPSFPSELKQGVESNSCFVDLSSGPGKTLIE